MAKHELNPDKWIDKHSDYLFNFTISRINDRDLAKDIVQDTFLGALKATKNFRGDASERTWLTSILKRKIIDYYRKSNSAKGKAEINFGSFTSSEEEDYRLDQILKDESSQLSDKELENIELGEAIYNCIDKLPQKQAEAFKMKTILEYDSEIICNELNITSSNFWVLIHRARTALLKCMEQKWFLE
jgi:RNA polymerase sigma-70 factor (TIGR02943 family)